ncbi:MAG: hypothetical protein K6G52_01095 [Treponemataceae bacterium]|nr:hypothetical protein [Treponemataceae bacterium]
MASKKSVGTLIITFALAVLLIVMGTQVLSSSGNASSGFGKRLSAGITAMINGDEISSSVQYLFRENRNNDLVNAIIIIIGILEICAGALVLINFFLPIKLHTVKSLLMWIVFGLWCLVIAVVDVLGNNGILGDAFKNSTHVLAWLKGLCIHLIILGSILVAKNN